MLRGPWENIIPKSSFSTFTFHLLPRKAEESKHGAQPTLSRLSQLLTGKELYLLPDSRPLHEGEEGVCCGAVSEAREQETQASAPSAEWLTVPPRLPNWLCRRRGNSGRVGGADKRKERFDVRTRSTKSYLKPCPQGLDRSHTSGQ